MSPFGTDGNVDGNDGTQRLLITTLSDEPGGRQRRSPTTCPILRRLGAAVGVLSELLRTLGLKIIHGGVVMGV